jgi:hypothetical protein
MGDVFLRKYGVEAKVDFALYKLDGTGLKTDAASASGDVTLYRDEGNVETLDADAFTDEGAVYSLTLSATEMGAARIIVAIVDQSSPQVWLDKTLIVETYGNASAQHEFDLDTATQSVNVSQIGGAAQSATDLKDFADTGYDPTTHKVETVKTADACTTTTTTVSVTNGVNVTQLGGAAQSLTDLKDFADTGYDPTAHKVETVKTADACTLTTTTTTVTNGVNVTSLGGVAQSLTDLKDFADAGYDPATHKVEAVKTADTCTSTTTTVTVTNDVGITQAGADKVWGTAARALTDKAGFSLSAAGVDAVLDEIVDANAPANANSLRETVNVIAAATAGKLSGAGTGTLTFRALGDDKDRITATLDVDNNRTAVTQDGT